MTFDLASGPSHTGIYRCAVKWKDSFALSEDGSEVPVRVYEPEAMEDSTLVWAHGGSWTRGSISDWHGACMALASMGNTRITSVDYRLAPEWPHPAAVLDVVAAALWAKNTFGKQVFLGGDSSGGSLAAGAALWFRDHQIQLGGQLLAYPPLDPACKAPSYAQPDQPFPRQSMLVEAWRAYAGTREGSSILRCEYLDPLHARDLRGMCPTAMLVGHSDPVRDDVLSFARQLTEAKVPVAVCDDPGVFHGQFLSYSTLRQNPVHEWVHQSLYRLAQTAARS